MESRSITRSPRGARRAAGRPAGLTAGFTLIEVLVVLVLIGVLVGLVTLSLTSQEERAVRQEADRLALLAGAAHQEAVLQGKVLALALAPGGYAFQVLGREGEFSPLTQDDMLRPRSLPPAMQIEAASIDGAPLGEGGRIVFPPSGEVPLFVISLVQGPARRRIEGYPTGVIRSVAPEG